MKISKTTTGVIAVALAAILWSSNAPFVRWISLDAFTVAAIRSLIAGVVLLPFLRVKKIPFNFNLLGFLLCFIGITAGIILAIKMTSSSIALGMQYTGCLWLFLLSKPSKKQFKLKRLWPMLLILVGVAVTMFSKADGITLLGNLIAISTSFTFAGMTYFAKKLKCENPIGLASLSNFAMGIVALLVARPSFSTLGAIPFNEWAVLIYLGVFQIGVSYALYYSGLRFVKATTASMLCPLEMILGPVWTAIFLGELPDIVGLCGFIVVIVGVLGEALVGIMASKDENEGLKECEIKTERLDSPTNNVDQAAE